MSTALRSVLAMFEDSLTVADLVRHQRLAAVDPGADVEEVHRWLVAEGYDQAPLRDVPVSSYVDVRWLAGATGAAVEHAQPIPDRLRLAETEPLLEALRRLRDEPSLFTTHREHVTGVVTRADLGQPAVSMLALGMVTALEQSFDELIIAEHGDSWIDVLPVARAQKVREVYEQRRRVNAELSLQRALNLDDRLYLVQQAAPAVREHLGYPSTAAYERAAKQLKRTRNCLAHGDGILGSLPDPLAALDELDRIRALAERAAAAADLALPQAAGR